MNRPQRPADRYLTTVLMTDIVGSTEHAAELGDRAWRDLVQLHHAAVRAALRRHGGREIDTAGDGFFATFDAPAAAVDCAIEVAERVRDLGIEIRAGVHVGEVEQIAGKVGGITVPIAARIMAAAEPGEVLTSSTVRDLAAGAGLRFQDRGTRSLKGVPGEWRIFAVARTEPAPDAAGAADAAQRRAAAVRSARSRPIWQRRPRLAAAVLGAAGLALVTLALAAWRPWQAPALPEIGEHSVGVIDAGRREVVASIDVGGQPVAIAVGGTAAWTAIAGDNTVARIDLQTRLVTRVVDVGNGPAAIVLAGGSAWVANGAERSLTRISEETARVVDTVDVGNRPIALAATDTAVWVAIAGDSAVVRVDAVTGEPGDPIPVPPGPIAIAADEASVWVASADAAVVTRLDAGTGAAVAAPIPLPARPTAMILGGQAAWVATQDGTVLRIEAATGRVTQTLDVGGVPASLALQDDVLWIADRSGAVHRVEPASPGQPPRTVATGAAPAWIAAAGPELVVATQAAPGSHRGGVLRVALVEPMIFDPLDQTVYHPAYLQADGLVGHRRVGGGAGAELLPALASSIPQPTGGGLSWTFQLRPDLAYADGRPVLASDFRRAIERSFLIEDFFGGAVGGYMWPSIEGADRCLRADGTPVERCDLSAGIQTDDAARTITFRLTAPDGDFLQKLAEPIGYPLPEGTPIDERLDGAMPGTGPYTIASATESEVRFVRNPHFRVFDARVRPDGFPDEIVYELHPVDAPPEERVNRVLDGSADYTPLRGPLRLPAEQQAQLGRQHPGLLHAGQAISTVVILDPAKPPFDDANVRRAVALALDRGAMVEALGGQPAAATTCQMLPVGWPGHRPYCPWTVDPDPAGRWRGVDLDRARELVAASGTAGAEVIVGGRGRDIVVITPLVEALEALGYRVTNVSPVADAEYFDRLGEFHSAVVGYIHALLSPSTFFDDQRCRPDGPGPCDEVLQRLIDEAAALQAIDPARAAEAWAAADRRVVDQASWIPVFVAGADLVSERVGNVQFHPQYLVLLDQLWVQ